jgi:hypothetical protein
MVLSLNASLLSAIIPKDIFKCKNVKIYIPAAFGGGDDTVFFTSKKVKV